ncbi:vWA domain-containing protein [Clostridium sp. Marseille-P299]|uniref:vWA domain-containing protein n=1 Tax=Clostridium sp. Marseille-P299 TaxID=1805477 RepID=UPI0008310277|nr:VWA-like domain-containing protein [Clostridium sp. Marseille-P299]
MGNDVKEKLTQIGTRILVNARNELYLSMRFLDVALNALSYEFNLTTFFVGTDGVNIYYNPRFLMERYETQPLLINRAYLHMILHCIFRHMYEAEDKEEEEWNLACDIATEYIIDSLNYKAITRVVSDYREEVYNGLEKRLKVLNAEGIYKILMEEEIPYADFVKLTTEFLSDDHVFWKKRRSEEPAEGNADASEDQQGSNGNENNKEESNESKNGSENNSKNSSENDSKDNSENNSKNGLENDSKNDSENNSKNSSENDSKDNSESNSKNSSVNDSNKDSENNSKNGSNNDSKNGSNNNSKNGSLNHDKNDSINNQKINPKNNPKDNSLSNINNESSVNKNNSHNEELTKNLEDNELQKRLENQRKQEKLKEWSKIGEKMKTNLETFSFKNGSEALNLQKALNVELRQRYDYKSFLRKFAVQKEVMQVDTDSFDYGFYNYGIQTYGNMPLMEHLEYKEVEKIEEFVIAIDTSGSCSGEVVQKFLEQTYSVLRTTESFLKKVQIHIIQCDMEIKDDTIIRNIEEFETYMKDFTFQGFGGTDFRPVFEYVDQLIKAKQIKQLKGMLYFTDGFGTYPTKRPNYDVAFIFLKDDYSDANVPSWAMKLILSTEDIMTYN